LAVHLFVDSGRFVQKTRKPNAMEGEKKVSGSQTWSIELPQKSSQPFSYKLVAFAASHPLKGILKRMLSIKEFEDAAQELADDNIDMMVHRHRVLATPR
jgi:hypothetical protein